MSKKWICFFSQTGSEINNVRKALNRDPDIIITNKQDLTDVNAELLNDCFDRIRIIPRKSLGDQYKKILYNCNAAIITLHGYLRIIPEEICENYKIYNLHPGLITKYPELKGFNPQEKAFNMELEKSGAVIHEVTSQLDSGKILDSVEVNIKNLTLDEVYKALHDASTDLWVKFLKDKI